MKILALENFSPRWWIPPGQEGAGSDQVAFYIRPLDGQQYAEVAQHAISDADGVRFKAEASRVALRHGLLKWRNLMTPSGQLVKCSPANYRLLPFEIRSALFAEILEISNLSEDQEKNSASPSKLAKIGTDSIA